MINWSECINRCYVNMKKIIILLTNPLEMDNKVCNEAKALINASFDVVVYAWDRERKYSSNINGIVDGIRVKRVLIKSAYGQGLKQLFGFISFWIVVFWRLMIFNFDIVHCVDLNTLVPGFLAAKIKRKKVVYDSHEDFPASMLDAKVKHLAPLAERVESFIIKRVNMVIAVSNGHARILKLRGAKKLYVIPTTKLLSEYNYTEEELFNLRKKFGLEKKFIFLYMGLLYRHRNLLEIIEIFKKYVAEENVFLIGGYGILEEEIKKAASNCKNVIFTGMVLASEVSLYTKASNVLFALSKSTSRNMSTTIPNKLFEAIAAGKPIIGSNVGPLGQTIRETNCGIAINPDKPDEIKNVILRIISDKNLYSQLCLNAVKVQKIYNWEKTSRKLVKHYKEIVKNG